MSAHFVNFNFTFFQIWVIFEKKSEFFYIRIFVMLDYGGTGGSEKFRFSLAMLFQESKMELSAHRSTPSPTFRVV